MPPDNLALLVSRQNKSNSIDSFFITKYCSEMNECPQRTIQSYHFPLYLYPENNAQQTLDGNQERTPNLNKEIVNKIAQAIGLTFRSRIHPSPYQGEGKRVRSMKRKTLPQ